MATPYDDLINQLYQEQLGRTPDPGGAEFWASQLAGGATPQQVREGIARSLEGQNFLTQAITSAYRQELARNPEQGGYQFWLSAALQDALSADAIRKEIAKAAEGREKIERGISGQQFTEMILPDYEADPFGGRYATTNIFDIPQNEVDRINISTIMGRPVQFVNPVTQQQYITNYGNNGQWSWDATPGEEVLSEARVAEATKRAFDAGSLTRAEYNQVINDLTKATKPSDIREILAKPQGTVIIDQIYGQQIGEDDVLEAARQEAALRQAVLTAQDPGYYQASDVLGRAYEAAGLDWPFFTNTYKADTMMTQANKLTPENFNKRVNQLLTMLGQQFGGANALPTQLGGQYYSETGLQPGFTPFGTEGTTFRSGVAGYTPQLPTRFEFGAPPVNAMFRQYSPGAFQPEGVTTGGYITGYTPEGTPIYSTLANPNVNVSGVQSQLIPFNAQQQQQLAALQADYDARLAAQAATQGSSGG